MEKKQAFRALSKICLNNWHYIDKRILTLSEGINFFTGHSGSGKSTVIDALQIVLYANTDGRRFFNKAAADDSDRTLIEYLRGMVNISENNEFQYLRNQNFSSTIVLEFQNTATSERQCVGVVFDVETASNEISRLFFWHMGGLLENQYRAGKRCLSTAEMREYLQRNFTAERYYCGPNNERFRRQMYDIYLGGLDGEKFPRLFKRAIPFRMNIKLEDFVKEYICMEQDIHIEDLKESVMQYGRMQSRIEETLGEIRRLGEIRKAFDTYQEARESAKSCDYQIRRLEMLQSEEKSLELKGKVREREDAIKGQEVLLQKLSKEQEALQKEYEELLLRIADSGYSGMEQELASLNETLMRLEAARTRWKKTAEGLKEWKKTDLASNQLIWDVEKFDAGTVTEEELVRLQETIRELFCELEEERRETDSALRSVKREEKEAREELKELKQGKKAYPREVEEARFELRNRLRERCGRFVNVQILADLLEIRDERWRNAVEGYLGENKLLLVTEPEFAKDAIEIYAEMDRKQLGPAAVLDSCRASEEEHPVRPGALAEEVIAEEPHVRAYIDFILGNVMKCENARELMACHTGITPDCMLYRHFSLQHIDSEYYTRRAYIGEMSMRQRILRLEERCQSLQEKRLPLQERLEEIRQLLQYEALPLPASDYIQQLKDMEEIPGRERRKKELEQKIGKLKNETVDAWEQQKKELMEKQAEKSRQIEKARKTVWANQSDIQKFTEEIIAAEGQLKDQHKSFEEFCERLDSQTASCQDGPETGFSRSEEYEEELTRYLNSRRTENYDYLRRQKIMESYPLKEREEAEYQKLINIRGEYIRSYPNRTFSTGIKDNDPYDRLMESLSCDELETYRETAKEQARSAVEHFKDDFIFKIRSAIREAYQRRDELNRVISGMDFGKDKYQFVITKNKGADGKYYRMFMDDSLNIQPSQLTNHMDNQLNMFTMEHEDQYGEMMNELISIFIPPENATKEELDEAKRNMDKYADYRTYLSFDMQQIVKGEKDMTIGLSRMIKKNSGGEGQNPLYVALLASFAQVYRIHLPQKLRRTPTIRLVVLDEAFSKMDAEKVASCISLIRGLGFQAIISATNDKIQNYLENVDKTFVYANPNKKHISIQEFERKEFDQLADFDVL